MLSSGKPLAKKQKITMPKKFIPLNKALTFFTLDILKSPKNRFKPADFKNFFEAENLESVIDSYLSQLHPAIDQSLEGDIYSQNEKRTRSIVEEISNSIDAHPEAIHCTIQDGYYEIREANGDGMSPEIICTKYLPPKASTKTNSEKQIGRFGIGSFTKLAHLNGPDASVVVETRARGHIGYRLEYRLINGELCITLSTDPSIQDYGTVTKVTSTEIKAVDYESMLRDNIGDDNPIPIYINQELFAPNPHDHQASISINNINITRKLQDDDTFTTKVNWTLPHGTTISESRNKILLDNEKTLKALQNYIDAIQDMPYPNWVLYANTIAPLVADIQTTNNSLLASDNILDYLIKTTRKKLANNLCVPDLPIYKPLQVPGVTALHPLLMPEEWIKHTTQLAPEWSLEGTAIVVAPMTHHPDDVPFIHDKDHDRVIIAADYYQKLKSENNLAALDLIFKYPPDEINAKPHIGFGDSKTVLNPKITFKNEVMQNPLHGLYQNHGMLWFYGDAFTKNILKIRPDAEAILNQAKTLITIYPAQYYLSYPTSSYQETVSAPLTAINFAGKKFYYHEGELFDDRFQPLFDEKKYQLLKAKIKQTLDERVDNGSRYDAELDTLTLDIEISADDVLAVKIGKNVYELQNGLGEKISDRVSPFMYSRHLTDDYYIISIRENQSYTTNPYLYRRSSNNFYSLGEHHLHWKCLGDNSDLLAGYDSYGNIECLYKLSQQNRLLSKFKHILYDKNFILGVNDDYFDRSLVLCDLNGEVLYETQDLKNRNIEYFDCTEADDVYNLSLLDSSGKVRLYQIPKSAPQNKVRHFGSKATLGFPVQALLSPVPGLPKTLNQITSGLFKKIPLPSFIKEKTRITPLYATDRESFDVVFPNKFKNKGNHYFSFSDYKDKKPLNYYYNSAAPFVIEYNNQFAFIDKQTLTLTPFQLNWSLNDIEEVREYKDHYYLKHATNHKKNKQLTAVFNKQGQFLGQGYRIKVQKTNRGDCMFIDGYLYTPEGKKITEEKLNYTKSFPTEDRKLIEVSYKRKSKEDKNYRYAIFDGQGIPQFINESIDFPSKDKEKGYYQFSLGGDLHTPYGSIEKGRLQGSNNHPTKSIDDLIVVKGGHQELLYNRAGYPFFKHVLPEYHNLLRQHIFTAKKSQYFDEAHYKPLSPEDLSNPVVLDNLAYLNQLNLDIFSYGSALRFINWPRAALQSVIPHINLLSYTPTIDNADDYQTLLNYAERLSEQDRKLFIKIFDLIYSVTHEQLVEPIAQKLINVVEIYGFLGLTELHDSLQKNRFILNLTPSFETSRPIIEEMPTTAAQICFYLLYPEKQLLAQQTKSSFEPLKNNHTLSLMDFMIAYQFDTRILENLLNNPDAFIQQVNERAVESDKSHPLRLLQHAIYYQADPNKHLYERELLQNSLDAYAAVDRKGKDASIEVDLYREGDHCVFRMRDQALGMSLKDVFYYYVLLGTSSKREDRHRRFIGGHGIGAFTIYHNASLVRLKTGQNDGYIHCFEFRPIYDSKDRIIDIEIKWEKQSGNFQGVEIERVSRSNRPTLDAARHHRTFKMHGKTVNADVANITLNQKPINQSLRTIASINIPDLGPLTLYSSIDDMVTAGGLSVRPVNNLDHFVPEDIRKVLRKKGVIIDLPKQIPLNRERTEVIDADHVYAYLKPYILQGYIEAYVRVFMQDNMSLSELPYDFFANFERYVRDMEVNNPAILEDAENIKSNKPLKDYNKYQSTANLHELMAFLPLFQVDKIQTSIPHHEPEKDRYTLIELAKYYRRYRSFPPLVHHPLCLKIFAERYDQEEYGKLFQNKLALELDNFPQIDWIPLHYQDIPYWQALTKISEYIAKCMGYNMNFGFSTSRSGDLLHTRRGTKMIYWNVYSLQESPVMNLMKELMLPNAHITYILDKLLDDISHEIVHAQLEEECGNTHNRTFSLKQRKILIELSKNFNKNRLIEDIKQIFADCIPKDQPVVLNNLDWKLLLQTQFLNDKNSDSARALHSLFATNNKQPAQAVDEMEIENMQTKTI